MTEMVEEKAIMGDHYVFFILTRNIFSSNVLQNVTRSDLKYDKAGL